MGSVESCEKVMRACRDITDKPLKAIIYTHNHGDHTFGGPGMVRHEANPEAVHVWAHDSTSEYIDRVVNVPAPVIGARSNRIIGALLPPGDEGLVHYGLANEVETAMPGNHPGLLRPTHTSEWIPCWRWNPSSWPQAIRCRSPGGRLLRTS